MSKTTIVRWCESVTRATDVWTTAAGAQIPRKGYHAGTRYIYTFMPDAGIRTGTLKELEPWPEDPRDVKAGITSALSYKANVGGAHWGTADIGAFVATGAGWYPGYADYDNNLGAMWMVPEGIVEVGDPRVTWDDPRDQAEWEGAWLFADALVEEALVGRSCRGWRVA